MSVTEEQIKKIAEIIERRWWEWSASEPIVEEIREVLGVPKPKTMEGVEWDNDTHYLAEVDTRFYGKLYMIRPDRHNEGSILVGGFGEEYSGKYKVDSMQATALTPTGKKHRLAGEAPALYSDKDGDIWEFISGGWVVGDTSEAREAFRRNQGAFSLKKLSPSLGPYTKIN